MQENVINGRRRVLEKEDEIEHTRKVACDTHGPLGEESRKAEKAKPNCARGSGVNTE